jgi:uncharacterized ferritin-like protein (DUF455 family)
MVADQPLGLRLTLHQRIGECTGVHGAFFFVNEARRAGDLRSAEMFHSIGLDEIEHVRYGTKWCAWLGNAAEEDPLLDHAHFVRQRQGRNDSGPLAFPLSKTTCEMAGVKGRQLEQLQHRWDTFGSHFK